MSIAIGYMPGAYGEGGEDPTYLRKLVEVGDKHDYDSLWLSDRIVGEKFSLEPMMACSMVLAYSDRLKVGTSVLAMPLRNPVVLAKQIATLDYLSQGRFFPAVGLGQEEPEEYEACGVGKEDRGPRTDEAIRLMRRLWRSGKIRLMLSASAISSFTGAGAMWNSIWCGTGARSSACKAAGAPKVY